MATAREFTISLEDRPGTLGKLCQALAEERVNILAYQQFPHEKGNGSVRLVVDNPDKAESVLDRQRSNYKETEVAQVKRAHRPGELGRAASSEQRHSETVAVGLSQTHREVRCNEISLTSH